MQKRITIRKATIDDLPALLQCEQSIIAAERPYDSTLKAGEIHYYDLEAMLSNPVVEVVVGDCKGEIIASGYARLEDAQPYLTFERQAHLGCMYVHPGYRGKGIIGMILDKLAFFAKANGVNELRLEVYAGNEAALKAYEKAGFAPYLVQMRREA